MKISRFSIIIIAYAATLIALLGVTMLIQWSYPIETILWLVTLVLAAGYFYLMIVEAPKRRKPTKPVSASHL